MKYFRTINLLGLLVITVGSAHAETQCQSIARSKFSKRVLFTPDDVAANASSVSIYDLDEKTSEAFPPDWALAEWKTRQKVNREHSQDLWGFFVHKGETLSSGKTSPFSLVIVKSTDTPELLKHELLHWAFASADSERIKKRAEGESGRQRDTDAFVTALKKVPKISVAELTIAADAINRSLIAIINDTGIEESLIGCLFLESKSTLSANRQAHFDYAIKNLENSAAPFKTIRGLITKLPSAYSSAAKSIDTTLKNIDSLKVKLEGLLKL